MKDAWRNQPASAWLKPVGLRIVENTVVAFVPPGKTPTDVFFCRAWLKTKVSVRKIARSCIQLGREVVTFWLAFPSYQLRLLLTLVEVMGDWAKIVEELAVNRPALVGVPQRAPDQPWPFRL